MPSQYQTITLQLWIDDRLYLEQVVNTYMGRAAFESTARKLYNAYRITIGRKPWFICQKLESKMNANLHRYAGDIEPLNKIKSAA